MAALSISVGVFILVVAGWLISRLILKYQQKNGPLRFRIWLMQEGAGRISDVPVRKHFIPSVYCEDIKNKDFLIRSSIDDWVILKELYELIIDSVETVGSCTFLYLKAIFQDFLGLPQRDTEPSCDEKLKKILEYAQKNKTIIFVKNDILDSDQPSLYYSVSAYKHRRREEKDARTPYSEKSIEEGIQFDIDEVGQATVNGASNDQLTIEIKLEDGNTYRFKTEGNQIISSRKGAMAEYSYRL